MATAASHSVNASDSNHPPVPDHDAARLMYYLNCVTVSVGFDILPNDLVDYQNYHLYSGVRMTHLFKSAERFSPECFIHKLLFRDDGDKVVPPGPSNKFVDVKAAREVECIGGKFVLAGRSINVTKVMFFRSSWLTTFYYGPLNRIAKIISDSEHSECPKGEGDCSTAPPGSDGESKHPSGPAPFRTTNQSQWGCDGCGWRNATGPRFNCNQCYNYDLCDGCYKANKHIDTGHRFSRYERPDDSPVSLPVRSIASSTSPPPPPPSQKATRTNTTKTTTTGTAPAPPVSELDNMPLSSSPNANPAASTFFYQSKSISQLKAFLEEHDVDVDFDILNIEALCKCVWETYCDCMTTSELKAFLSSKAISTAGCKSINDRREKAKAAFEPPLRPPAARNTGGSGGWRKDDIVALTGLRKADLNGKVGKVQVVDAGAGRATVWVDDLGRALKVKYEHLEPYVEPQVTADKTPGRDSRNVPKTNPPQPSPTETPSQPASSATPTKATGYIHSQSGGRFIAVFIIDDIQYIFAGHYNPNPGTYKVNRATLEYPSKAALTGTRPLTGIVGPENVRLAIDNGPLASGALRADNYFDFASNVVGAGTWTTT